MAEKIIYVSRNGRSNELKLRNKGANGPAEKELITEVDPKDTVLWQLDENSGLSGITGIKESDTSIPRYKNSQKLWVDSPTKNNGGWKATVIPVSPGRGKFQNYTIGYKLQGDEKEHWHDPKILMKT